MRISAPARAIGLAAIAAALAVAPAALAGDPPKRLPEGSTIAGVDVGGLGPIGAERAVRAALSPVHDAPISVRVGRSRRSVIPSRAGSEVDYDAMVDRAFEAAGDGRQVAVPLDLSIHGGRLTRETRRIQRAFRRDARNARVRFGVRRVKRIRHRTGRRLDRSSLRHLLIAEMRSPSERRVVRPSWSRVVPRITTRKLGSAHPTYISVDRRSFTLRLFKRLRVVRTYRIAVGAAGYDTPRGLHSITSRQVNPAWHAPNRPWAGALAGKTIPPGDPRNPLKARWLGIAGGVGIHGTSEEWSIGSRASHGCIRMRVRDVKLLFPHVPLGTPVLIR